MARGQLTIVADAVKDLIQATVAANNGELGRVYFPETEIEDLASLVVQVVPRQETRERGGRKFWYRDYTVDVGIQKRVPTDADVDAMTALQETLASLLTDTELTGVSVALLNVKLAGPYPPHLDQKGVYTGVITATYRGGRVQS